MATEFAYAKARGTSDYDGFADTREKALEDAKLNYGDGTYHDGFYLFEVKLVSSDPVTYERIDETYLTQHRPK